MSDFGSERALLDRWALRSPDWAVDARALILVPFLFIGLVALLVDPLLPLLLFGMLLLLVFVLSVEPISGLFLIALGPLAAWFWFGAQGAVITGVFLVLLGLLGLLWTLRSIRFEMRRAERISR